MFKQKAIFDKDFNLIDFKEYHNNSTLNVITLTKHEKYDDMGNRIYYEDLNGWIKYEFDNKGKVSYFEGSSGYWVKYKYSIKGSLISTEDSSGNIMTFSTND